MKETIYPHDDITEEIVLGQLLARPSLFYEFDLVENDFYSNARKNIFNSIKSVLELDESISGDITGRFPEFVRLHLKENNLLDKSGGAEYLLEILRGFVDSVSFKALAKKLRDYRIKRAVIKKGTILTESVLDNCDIDTVSQLVDEISDDIMQSDVKTQTISESLIEYDNRLSERLKSGQDNYENVRSYFDNLDSILNCFEKGGLYILASPPSMGKSAFSLSLALNQATAGKRVKYFAVEMTKANVLSRLIASCSKINSTKLKYCTIMSDSERRAYSDAIDFLSLLDIDIDYETDVTIEYIKKTLQKDLQRGKEYDIIYIDHLQYMHASGKVVDKNTETGIITKGLARISQKFNIPVVALCQMNRGVMSRNIKRPVLSDLRDSGNIEADAEGVIFVHRDDYYRRGEPGFEDRGGITEIIIEKQREGKTGTAYFNYDMTTNNFYETIKPPPEDGGVMALKSRWEPKK